MQSNVTKAGGINICWPITARCSQEIYQREDKNVKGSQYTDFLRIRDLEIINNESRVLSQT